MLTQGTLEAVKALGIEDIKVDKSGDIFFRALIDSDCEFSDEGESYRREYSAAHSTCLKARELILADNKRAHVQFFIEQANKCPNNCEHYDMVLKKRSEAAKLFKLESEARMKRVRALFREIVKKNERQ